MGELIVSNWGRSHCWSALEAWSDSTNLEHNLLWTCFSIPLAVSKSKSSCKQSHLFIGLHLCQGSLQGTSTNQTRQSSLISLYYSTVRACFTQSLAQLAPQQVLVQEREPWVKNGGKTTRKHSGTHLWGHRDIQGRVLCWENVHSSSFQSCSEGKRTHPFSCDVGKHLLLFHHYWRQHTLIILLYKPVKAT